MPEKRLFRLSCKACNKHFMYRKTTNVIRKYCKECAKVRTAASKRKYKEEQKMMMDEVDTEEIKRSLQAIPDYEISKDRLFASILRAAT